MSPSFKSMLAEADSTQKIDLHKDDPNVKLSGYLYNFDYEKAISTLSGGEKLGIAADVAADIYA